MHVHDPSPPFPHPYPQAIARPTLGKNYPLKNARKMSRGEISNDHSRSTCRIRASLGIASHDLRSPEPCMRKPSSRSNSPSDSRNWPCDMRFFPRDIREMTILKLTPENGHPFAYVAWGKSHVAGGRTSGLTS